MDRQTVIDRLVAHEAELRAMGVTSLSLFSERLQDILGVKVDTVSEPVSKPRLRQRIDRDRAHVF
jgi:predicted nucleotidyltransferase